MELPNKKIRIKKELVLLARSMAMRKSTNLFQGHCFI